MKFVLYTNSLSEHQLPLAREIVQRIGDENFRYVYTGESGQKFQEGVRGVRRRSVRGLRSVRSLRGVVWLR